MADHTLESHIIVNISSAYYSSDYDKIAYNSSAHDNSAYNTRAHNVSAMHSATAEIDTTRVIFKTFSWIVIVLSLTAFIYGLTSWCLLKKFRHFRHYVLLNVMLANVLRNFIFLFFYWFKVFCRDVVKRYLMCVNGYIYFSLYCNLTFDYWLLVLCYIFYVDFVKVFNIDIRRRYLNSSLFGWGIPFVTFLIAAFLFYLYDSTDILTVNVAMFLELIPVTISLVIFLMVVYNLFRVSEAGMSISTNKWHRFYIAILIYILSNITEIYAIQDVLGIRNNLVAILGASVELLNSIALAVYFVIGKSNRILWKEYFKMRLIQTSLQIR